MTQQGSVKRLFRVSLAFWFSVGFALLPIIAGAAGLVPCGGLSHGENPCTYCDLLKLFKGIIDFLMYVIFPIATIMIIWGGIVIMTARESPEQVKRGRAIITAAVVGILIALLSWLILDTIFKVIAPNFKVANLGRPWQQLNCQ